MTKTVAIEIQDFGDLIRKNFFYIDKTMFIKEWWESNDNTTLITRPRRFGKTLNISMVEQFFSMDYADNGDIFEGLYIWEDEKYRQLQGTYPVISLSFASVKEATAENAKEQIRNIIKRVYKENIFLRDCDVLTDDDKYYFNSILSDNAGEVAFTNSINQLSDFLYRYHGKKVIILLDEYDTPMQEAYVHDYWQEIVVFLRSLFNSAFKTNPYLERALMTGITRVSKESIFSDLNHLEVVTIEPKDKRKNAIILEFKVLNHRRESNLEETVAAALKQIEDKQYESQLEARGIFKENIRKYGIAFQGKKVLIG